MSLQNFHRSCVHLIKKTCVRSTSAFRYHMILREVFLSVIFVWCDITADNSRQAGVEQYTVDGVVYFFQDKLGEPVAETNCGFKWIGRGCTYWAEFQLLCMMGSFLT